MTALLDLPAIRAAQPISAVIGQSLSLKRAGREFVARCPFHDERSPSFTVNDDKGFAHCFGCGWHGDVLDFVQAAFGVGLREAAERIGGGAFPRLDARPVRVEAERDTVADAIAIWRASAVAPGTPVETYLRGARGLSIDIPPTIRFASLRYGSRGPEHPCLVALVVSADNKPLGIQRTYLRADGRGKLDVLKPKLSLGRVRGGAIRLAPAAASLVVTEGLEDGLSVQQQSGLPVWVAAGASMLPSMNFPDAVRSVAIGRDNDAAGERSAAAAVQNFTRAGLTARVFAPAPGFKDFNAELTGVTQ